MWSFNYLVSNIRSTFIIIIVIIHKVQMNCKENELEQRNTGTEENRMLSVYKFVRHTHTNIISHACTQTVFQVKIEIGEIFQWFSQILMRMRLFSQLMVYLFSFFLVFSFVNDAFCILFELWSKKIQRKKFLLFLSSCHCVRLMCVPAACA